MSRIKNIYFVQIIKNNIRKIFISFVLIVIVAVVFWTLVPKQVKPILSIKKVFESETLRLRYQKYIPPAIWLFKQNPLFGSGLWSYRNMVYEAQAQLNKSNPSFFKDYDDPKPRRAHNDYVEILADGGLLAASTLLLFLILVLKHGWNTIHNKDLSEQDRIISAMAFFSVVAMLITAFFFFPFRLNTTMFMTVLMMGLIEGIYNRHYGHISIREMRSSPYGWAFILISILIISGLFWNMGVRPFIAERYFYQYKKTLELRNPKEAERLILMALAYDPHCTPYAFHASQLYLNIFNNPIKAKEYIDRAIIDFNGDLTRWSVYYYRGLINYRIGSLLEARSDFEKCLYYWPHFELAQRKLAEVNDIIKKHDRVIIKLR